MSSPKRLVNIVNNTLFLDGILLIRIFWNSINSNNTARLVTGSDASFVETHIIPLRGKMTCPKAKERARNISELVHVSKEYCHVELNCTKETDL